MGGLAHHHVASRILSDPEAEAGGLGEYVLANGGLFGRGAGDRRDAVKVLPNGIRFQTLQSLLHRGLRRNKFATDMLQQKSSRQLACQSMAEAKSSGDPAFSTH